MISRKKTPAISLCLVIVAACAATTEAQRQDSEVRAEWLRQVSAIQNEIAATRKAIADNAKSERLKFMRPRLYMILGDYLVDLCDLYSIASLPSERTRAAEGAKLAFQGAVLNGDQSGSPLYGSGRAAACSEDYLSAVDFYKRSLRVTPSLPKAHRDLGVAYFKLGRFRNAREVLEIAVRNDPDDSIARIHLATSYLQLGQPLLAREQCETLKELGLGILCRSLKFPDSNPEKE